MFCADSCSSKGLSSSSPKLYGKVYFYAKKSRSESNTESVGNTKHEEIRKISLPPTYQEFYNLIMLSLAKETNDRQHLSDSHLALSSSSLSSKSGLILKYLGQDENWVSFSSQEEYDNALSICKCCQNHCIRIRVYYKKSLFKSSSSRSKKCLDSHQCIHNLTICSDFEELQRLMREHATSNSSSSSSAPSAPSTTTTNSSTSSSNSDQFFQFWSASGSSCLESKA
ncbi:hypothetical protein C9374_006838 [Naegleria lovaniensis]|uniref:PB1 domain-containing protein n=1 Tax=Naegleria lovaniensis TaxID=51637 RepID=A0AA88KRJ8_NAELO|nr:uncharacterized protein C9374_006838 [Naegleria lovaniensis]KAG2393307.1 hypothetical protein C9374_006838 [Naegleria lovaniensis]